MNCNDQNSMGVGIAIGNIALGVGMGVALGVALNAQQAE
jgi:hypothetical protein